MKCQTDNNCQCQNLAKACIPTIMAAAAGALTTYLCQSENRKRVFAKVKDWVNSLKVSTTQAIKVTQAIKAEEEAE